VIASIGVSGAASNQDEQCAQAGFRAFGRSIIYLAQPLRAVTGNGPHCSRGLANCVYPRAAPE